MFHETDMTRLPWNAFVEFNAKLFFWGFCGRNSIAKSRIILIFFTSPQLPPKHDDDAEMELVLVQSEWRDKREVGQWHHWRLTIIVSQKGLLVCLVTWPVQWFNWNLRKRDERIRITSLEMFNGMSVNSCSKVHFSSRNTYLNIQNLQTSFCWVR